MSAQSSATKNVYSLLLPTKEYLLKFVVGAIIWQDIISSFNGCTKMQTFQVTSLLLTTERRGSQSEKAY